MESPNRFAAASLLLSIFTLLVLSLTLSFSLMRGGLVIQEAKAQEKKSDKPTKRKLVGSGLGNNPAGKHGTSSVLRVRGSTKGKKKQALRLVKPQWNKPFELTYRKLATNYQYYLVNDKFFEKGLPRIHGAAVTIIGAVMPIDPVGEKGELRRFWLANPTVVMAGCVFCNPPTLADLIYVEVDGEPLEIDRETLYKDVVMTKLLGRFFIGATTTKDKIQYMFRLELKEVLE